MLSEGRVAVVTGAGSGIGRACAETLAAQGVRVAAFDIDEKAARQTVAAIEASGGQAIAHQVDVTDPDHVERAFGEVMTRWGRADIAVHCAGILYDRTIRRLQASDWARVMKVNGEGTFLFVKSACEAMATAGYGRIVCLSSAAYLGNFGQAAYGAAKATVVNLVRVAALEYARKGVTINAVAPGVVETPMTAAMPAEALGKLAEMVPVGRVAAPADIVHLVLALVDDAAGYITGQTVIVDGGLTLGTPA